MYEQPWQHSSTATDYQTVLVVGGLMRGTIKTEMTKIDFYFVAFNKPYPFSPSGSIPNDALVSVVCTAEVLQLTYM